MISFLQAMVLPSCKIPLSLCGGYFYFKYPKITITLHYLFIIYEKPEKSPELPHIQIFSPKYSYLASYSSLYTVANHHISNILLILRRIYCGVLLSKIAIPVKKTYTVCSSSFHVIVSSP